MGGDVEVIIGGQDTEVVEIISCTTVVSVCILELSKGVQGVDLLKGDLDQSKRIAEHQRISAIIHCNAPLDRASFGFCLVAKTVQPQGFR